MHELRDVLHAERMAEDRVVGPHAPAAFLVGRTDHYGCRGHQASTPWLRVHDAEPHSPFPGAW